MATSTGQSSTVGGGAAGSYARAYVTSGFSGVTVTVLQEVDRPVLTGGNGGNASTASFGSIVSCPGGNGAATSGTN